MSGVAYFMVEMCHTDSLSWRDLLPPVVSRKPQLTAPPCPASVLGRHPRAGPSEGALSGWKAGAGGCKGLIMLVLSVCLSWLRLCRVCSSDGLFHLPSPSAILPHALIPHRHPVNWTSSLCLLLENPVCGLLLLDLHPWPVKELLGSCQTLWGL